MHVHNRHRSQCYQQFEPTALRTPTVLKAQYTLSLFVGFINQWQVFVEEMGELWPVDLFKNNISEVVFKG